MTVLLDIQASESLGAIAAKAAESKTPKSLRHNGKKHFGQNPEPANQADDTPDPGEKSPPPETHSQNDVHADTQDGPENDPLAGATDPAADALAAAVSAVREAIDRLADDPGTCLTPEAAAAWSAIERADPAEFERLRKAAQRAGARVTEIDKLVGVRARYARERQKARNYSGNNPSDPSDIRAESFRESSERLPNSEGLMPPDGLLETDEDGTLHRLIESKAAEIVAWALKCVVAWDGDAGSWLLWRDTHWEPQTVASAAERLIADAVHVGTGALGYKPNYLNGITLIAQRRGLLAPPTWATGVVPFENGLLDLATRDLLPATPDHATTWCLPHRYDAQAACPAIKAWLLRCVEGDDGTVELLRAWLAALLLGLPLQKFLLLIGRGGSGKGTFQRLAVALVGVANNATSSLRDLEENRFETAKLYGKRLCSINEAGKHGGSLNMLKAVTGGDHLPLERKHVQQSGSFIFGGLVLMATNEDLQSTDSTSGLERRRITVRFPVSATPAEKADWEARGGEDAVLHAEIPGLINWLIELSPAEIRARIESPPDRVVTDNLLGMAAGNSVADWLLSETIPDDGAWTQVGVKVESRDPGTGKTYYEHSDEWLYPSYLAWCLAHGRASPVSLRKLRDTVADMAETLGHPVKHGRHPVSRAYSVLGLRLRKDGDASEGWRNPNGRIDAYSRKDRKDSGPNFGAEFSPHAHTDAEVAL